MKTLVALFFKALCVSLLSFSVPLYSLQSQQDFITYEFSGGRFGDNLLAYLHAKWVSYRHQIPLLYKPFLYSSQLALHDIEKHYYPGDYQQYSEIYICEESDMKFTSMNTSRLYICPYFPECPWERSHLKGPTGGQWSHFQVDWQNPGFRAELKQLIALKRNYPLITPPENRISIAIHFREGGGYDTGDVALFFMTKVPPFTFYLEGLSQVVKFFPGKPLYCYLFTDAQNPLQYIKIFKQSLPPEIDIVFDCRTDCNSHNKNVLEDFFSLFNFDVLIHPQSNYSLVPSLIHDYAITYSPLSGTRDGTTVMIDKVKCEISEGSYKRLMQ